MLLKLPGQLPPGQATLKRTFTGHKDGDTQTAVAADVPGLKQHGTLQHMHVAPGSALHHMCCAVLWTGCAEASKTAACYTLACTSIGQHKAHKGSKDLA